MTFGDLCAGIGGFSLGLERAGMELRWQVEIDEFCRQVLARHWPGIPRPSDVRDCAAPGVLAAVDVVAAGFPCQPVSCAGRCRGEEDPRWLWPDIVRVLHLLGPRYVFLENVPGLRVRGLGAVLRDLALLGYDAEWESLPASAFGAPHIRERVFIVAYPGREGLRESAVRIAGRGDAEVPRQHGGARALADAVRPQRGAEAADGNGAHREDAGGEEAAGGARERGRDGGAGLLAHPHRGGREDEEPLPGGEESEPRRRSRDVAHPDGRGRQAVEPGRELRGGAQPPGGGQDVADTHRPTGGHEEGHALPGARRATAPVRPAEPGGRGEMAHTDGKGRGEGGGAPGAEGEEGLGRGPSRCSWWDVEPGIRRVAHGVPRRVDRLRALGNAVVPQCVEWIGRRIIEHAEGLRQGVFRDS